MQAKLIISSVLLRQISLSYQLLIVTLG